MVPDRVCFHFPWEYEKKGGTSQIYMHEHVWNELRMEERRYTKER